MTKLMLNLLLFFGGVVTLIPFWAMVVPSLVSVGRIYAGEFHFIPRSVTFENYVNLFQTTKFIRWMFNTLIVSTASVVLAILFSSMAGFAFAKYRFKGRNFLFGIVLGSVSLPQIVTIIPMFALFTRIQWINTYQALVIPYATNAFAIFFMRQYMLSLPSAMLDAARIDGCTEFGIYWRIVLPTIKPAIGAVGTFLWLWSWNAYFWPLIMIRTDDMFTVPLGLATIYADPFRRDPSMLMAGSFLSILPIVAIFFLFQKQLIAGLTRGAIK